MKHTSVGSSATGQLSELDPTSRTMAVNSLPPSRNNSISTLSSIPYNIQNQRTILKVNIYYVDYVPNFSLYHYI